MSSLNEVREVKESVMGMLVVLNEGLSMEKGTREVISCILGRNTPCGDKGGQDQWALPDKEEGGWKDGILHELEGGVMAGRWEGVLKFIGVKDGPLHEELSPTGVVLPCIA